MHLPELAPAALVSFVLTFVQGAAALVQCAVLAYLARLFRRSWAAWWAAGWGALVVALFSVQLWVVTGLTLFRGTFLVFEWIFAGALLAGTREFARERPVSRRRFSQAIFLSFVPATLGALLPGTFDDLFALQALVLSAFFLLSFRELGAVEQGARGAGWTVMRTTLLMLTAVFLAWVPIFAQQSTRPVSNWASFSSVLDMLLEVGLGFGMVVAVSESAGAELRRTVGDLESARSELERRAQTDPLTGVLNRRAVEQVAVLTSGTAVMVDIDGLKEINDRFGHAAGDEAIRSAAEELRQRTRAGDSVFRWGGDEFLVVLPGAPESAVMARFADLEVGGTFVPPGGSGPASLRLSWGSAAFGPLPFAEAVALADERMYARRAARRGPPSSSSAAVSVALVIAFAFALALSTLVASPALAAVGPEKGGVAVGASLGAAFPFESDYRTGWTLAGTFDYYLSGAVGIRATLGYVREGTKLEGTTDPNATHLLASAVWTGAGEKLRPYALGGIGLYVFEPSGGGRSGRAGLHAGGGVELSVDRRWSLTGEGLFHFVGDAGDRKSSFFGLSGGVRYRF